MRETFPVRITGHDQIAPNSWLLKFRRTFSFEAGQVIGVSIDKINVPRLYSIGSGVNDPNVWILYTIKPDGLLTPPLSEAQVGDTIYITEPFGNFICNDEKAVWIASGTGIAPFASMFFSGQYHQKKLIQGNRYKETVYFQDYFAPKMGQNYIPCTSRESAEGCFPGRVTDYIESLESIDTGLHYYLCGIAEMVVDVRDLLISRGVPYNRIMAEIFF